MSVPNFSFLEVAEKFVGGGGGGFQVSTVSNLNASCLELLWVELVLGSDNMNNLINIHMSMNSCMNIHVNIYMAGIIPEVYPY